MHTVLFVFIGGSCLNTVEFKKNFKTIDYLYVCMYMYHNSHLLFSYAAVWLGEICSCFDEIDTEAVGSGCTSTQCSGEYCERDKCPL